MEIQTLRSVLNLAGGNPTTITNEVLEFSDLTFQNSDISETQRSITFTNCTFIGGILQFLKIKNQHLHLTFRACHFNCTAIFDSLEFLALEFVDTKAITGNFDLTNSTIRSFSLKNEKSNNKINGNLSIFGNYFLEKVDLESFKHVSGAFKFTNTLKTSQVALKKIRLMRILQMQLSQKLIFLELILEKR